MVTSSKSSKKINPLNHKWVPKHSIISLEEAYKVLKDLGIRPEQLPWLRASDPVAKAIGARPGDIVKIERRSPLGETSIVYRYVISG